MIRVEGCCLLECKDQVEEVAGNVGSGWLVCIGKACSQRVFCTLLELASPGRGGLSLVKCQSIKNLENKKRGFPGGSRTDPML